MDIIQENFKHIAVHHSNVWLYPVDDAKRIVQFCQVNGVKLFGLDAFLLFDNGIQPDMGNSLWFDKNANMEENYQAALEFLSSPDRSHYLFEMWYDGYQ